MAWVYGLCGSSGRHDIGSTTDLNRRLEQHRQGQTYSTRRLGRPLELAASLEPESLPAARAMERESPDFPRALQPFAPAAPIINQSHPARKLMPPTGVTAPSQRALVAASR